MKTGIFLGFLMICFIIGSCSAEENTDYIAFFQGGATALSEGTNGTMVLTVNDVIPYYHIPVVNRNVLMPLETESPYQLPLNAAIVLNGADGEAVFMEKVISWVYSSDEKTLTLDIKPVEFYEGTVLKDFFEAKQDLTVENVGKELSSGIYLEVVKGTPENYFCPDYRKCGPGCCMAE